MADRIEDYAIVSATFGVAEGESVSFVHTYLPSHKSEPAHLDAFKSLEQTR
jgi:hypothetical protein